MLCLFLSVPGSALAAAVPPPVPAPAAAESGPDALYAAVGSASDNSELQKNGRTFTLNEYPAGTGVRELLAAALGTDEPIQAWFRLGYGNEGAAEAAERLSAEADAMEKEGGWSADSVKAYRNIAKAAASFFTEGPVFSEIITAIHESAQKGDALYVYIMGRKTGGSWIMLGQLSSEDAFWYP